MNTKLIGLLFQAKAEQDLFCLENEDYNTLSNKKKEAYANVKKIIDERVHPESKNTLIMAIDEYVDALSLIYDYEDEYYYTQGFVDCLSIFKG